ncbi:transcriptional activator domain-containing protein [Pseudonocardia ammonioxydans]|uniref:Transcriptional activator domain-containing protein n=1 Tax=Pseudonocardia ammonioxydans TaxID=260086 RepID=A0A1I5FEV4_PSUAM|nr:AAA family ATPase [Pseudonocardia ammonioxydans]SFO22189.1 transcriptional activator domain-containing protein [Pseudonocardia ammonioxydans]
MDRAQPRPGDPDPVAARLVLRVLGDTGVLVDGHPVPEVSGPRGQRLLARLVLADGGVSRDRLAAELWPGSAAGQARTNLRKLLHEVRGRLPDGAVAIDRWTIRWAAGPAAYVDVLAFRRALARGDPAGGVRHYGGDLLPGCDDDWVLVAREELRRLAVGALADLVTAAAEAGDTDAVVTRAHALLRLDPGHEPGCRLLLRALVRRGERGEALRTYHRLTAALRELGAEPDPATVAAARPLTGAPAPGYGTLHGRRDEWTAVHRAWRQARAGQPRLLLVTGEAGIGKTRLVEELAARAGAEGAAVASGRAYEAAGGLPWGPVLDWLRSDTVRPALDRLPGVWRDELCRLLPELAAGRRAGAATTGAARRHRLLEAARRGLLAAGEPLLLVLDDLQWCDPDTLELCEYLVRASPPARLLVAGTARDDEADDHHPLVALRRRLAAARAAVTVVLGPLDRAATLRMAAALVRRDLDATAGDRLWAETDGNPLFVVEAVRAGLGAVAGHGLTPTIHAVVAARLDRLGAGARRLAEVAATVGRAAGPTVLAAAAGRSEDDLVDDLDELWHRHVLRERGAGYDFQHDRVRDVVLDAIGPARRRMLHRAVAEALESHHTDLGPVSARLAAHYEAAGLEQRAVAAYERAAAHAYRVFALDDGIALSQRALRLLDGTPRGAQRDEVELRLRTALGVPLVARRGYGADAVGRCYTRALTLHRRLGTRPGPAVLRGLGLHAVVTCRFQRAAELGHELLAAGDGDRLARVEGDYVLGVTRFWCGEFAAAEHHLGSAVTTYRGQDSPVHVAQFAQDPNAVCLSRLALTQLFRGRPADAAATMRRALRAAAELDHPMTSGYVLAWEAIRATLTRPDAGSAPTPDSWAPDGDDPGGGDLDRAVAELDAVTSPMHIDFFDTTARMLAGWRDVLAGVPGALPTLRAAVEAQRDDQPLQLTLGLSLLARAHLLTGDPGTGREIVADALTRTARTGQYYLLAELHRVDAELLVRTGDGPAAVAAAHRAITVAETQDAPWLRDRARHTLHRLGGR